MTTASMGSFLRRLTRGMAAETLRDESDRQLVGRLLAGRDEAVFEAVVRRHGPMVYRVCWRVLQQEQDTEDAFQATFLILARQLHTVRRHASVASWLHGIAHRVALRAQAQAATRRRHERKAAARKIPPDEVPWRELRGVLDAELVRLPEKWRLPLILCYLEGRTQDEVAGQLGWSQRTLRRRLEEARAALGRRLTGRGVVWPAALSAVLLSDCVAPAALSPGLVGPTVEAAAGIATGRAALTAAVPARVAALTEGVARAMMTSQLKAVAAVFALLGILTCGAWTLVAAPPAARPQPSQGAGPPSPQAEARPQGRQQPAPEPTLVREIQIEGYVGTVVLSQDGKVLATQTDKYKKNPDGPDFEIEASTIKVWDVGSGKELLSLGEVQNPTFRLFAFSEDGKSILVADRPGRQVPQQLQWYDVKTGERKRAAELDARAGRLALAPDGKRFASAFVADTPKGRTTGIYLGDPQTGKVSQTLPTGDDIHRTHRALAFSADGKFLASVALGNNQTVHIWDLETGKVKQKLDGADSAGFVNLAFSPDGKVLACAGGGREIQRWDLPSGKALPAFTGNGRRTNRVEFTADGKLLLCTGWGEDESGGEVVLLDAQTGEKFQGVEKTSGAAVARGQAVWAIASQDRGVKVWASKTSPGR